MSESMDVHDWIMDHYRSESAYAEGVVLALEDAGFYVGPLEHAYWSTPDGVFVKKGNRKHGCYELFRKPEADE